MVLASGPNKSHALLECTHGVPRPRHADDRGTGLGLHAGPVSRVSQSMQSLREGLGLLDGGVCVVSNLRYTLSVCIPACTRDAQLSTSHRRLPTCWHMAPSSLTGGASALHRPIKFKGRDQRHDN